MSSAGKAAGLAKERLDMERTMMAHGVKAVRTMLLVAGLVAGASAQQPVPMQSAGFPTAHGPSPKAVPATNIATEETKSGEASTPATAPAAATATAPEIPATVAAAGNWISAMNSPEAIVREAANADGKTGKMGQEGIKVHGHWVIDVRNPDGTLDQHHDFENSLNQYGGFYLTGLLTGYLVQGDWMVALGPGTGGVGPCGGATFPWCAIVRSTATHPGLDYCSVYVCSTGLTVTPNFGTTNILGPYSIVMAGSFTANQAGTLGSVYTIPNACANNTFQNPPPSGIVTTSAADCVTTSPNFWVGPFTNTNISSVTVANGQIVQVTVTLTFS